MSQLAVVGAIIFLHFLRLNFETFLQEMMCKLLKGVLLVKLPDLKIKIFNCGESAKTVAVSWSIESLPSIRAARQEN